MHRCGHQHWLYRQLRRRVGWPERTNEPPSDPPPSYAATQCTALMHQPLPNTSDAKSPPLTHTHPNTPSHTHTHHTLYRSGASLSWKMPWPPGRPSGRHTWCTGWRPRRQTRLQSTAGGGSLRGYCRLWLRLTLDCCWFWLLGPGVAILHLLPCGTDCDKNDTAGK
jgi:hypothetical protein